MKITKYPQSCVLIEQGDARILIDPGNHYREACFKPEDLGAIDAVLYTHQHGDHCDEQIYQYFISQGVPIYCNAATAGVIGPDNCTVVSDTGSFQVKGVNITARELPHQLMLNGDPGPQNTGYVVDEVFFHPGDGKAIEHLQVDGFALPITGPDVSVREAIAFIEQVGAKVVIPIHYHGIKLDPHSFGKYVTGYAKLNPDFSAQYVVLENGESTEL